MTKIDNSWRKTLGIWVERNRQAQGEIHRLQAENDGLREVAEEAMRMLSDDQLKDLRQRMEGRGPP